MNSNTTPEHQPIEEQTTPTIGSLQREIKDLHARVEELEIEAGLEDRKKYYSEEAIHAAIQQYLKHGGDL